MFDKLMAEGCSFQVLNPQRYSDQSKKRKSERMKENKENRERKRRRERMKESE
jgi:hypothetical protein